MTAVSLIDSHAHVNAPQFDADRDAVLTRAAEAGVALILDVGTEPGGWARSLALAERHEGIRCVLGLHPNSASLWSDALEDGLRELVGRAEVVGIGETGLDFYRLGAPPATQRAVFIRHLELAQESGLPLVIHARDAYDDILSVLEKHAAGTTGVLHSFAGGVGHALRAMELGYYISVSGPVTYPRGVGVREAAAAVRADRLLVETDCPYLSPHPHRGRRNEPAYVALTATAVARVRGTTTEAAARLTTENARRLFRL